MGLYLEGRDGGEQFSLMSAIEGASVEISMGHCFLVVERHASSATSCVEKYDCGYGGLY